MRLDRVVGDEERVGDLAQAAAARSAPAGPRARARRARRLRRRRRPPGRAELGARARRSSSRSAPASRAPSIRAARLAQGRSAAPSRVAVARPARGRARASSPAPSARSRASRGRARARVSQKRDRALGVAGLGRQPGGGADHRQRLRDRPQRPCAAAVDQPGDEDPARGDVAALDRLEREHGGRQVGDERRRRRRAGGGAPRARVAPSAPRRRRGRAGAGARRSAPRPRCRAPSRRAAPRAPASAASTAPPRSSKQRSAASASAASSKDGVPSGIGPSQPAAAPSSSQRSRPGAVAAQRGEHRRDVAEARVGADDVVREPGEPLPRQAAERPGLDEGDRSGGRAARRRASQSRAARKWPIASCSSPSPPSVSNQRPAPHVDLADPLGIGLGDPRAQDVAQQVVEAKPDPLGVERADEQRGAGELAEGASASRPRRRARPGRARG